MTLPDAQQAVANIGRPTPSDAHPHPDYPFRHRVAGGRMPGRPPPGRASYPQADGLVPTVTDPAGTTKTCVERRWALNLPR